MDQLGNLPNEPEKIQNPITEPPPMPSPVQVPEPTPIPSLISPTPTTPPMSTPFPVQTLEPKIISSPVVVPPLPPVEVPAPILPSVVKEKKEPIVFYILALILIVTGLLFSAYNFMQKKNSQTVPVVIPTSVPQPTESIPTPTPDPTANWKIYKNSKYGYSFKYPNLFTYVSETSNLLDVYIAPSEGSGEGKGGPYGLDLTKDSWLSVKTTVLNKAGLLQWNTKLASMEATLISDGMTAYKSKGENLSTQASEPVFGYIGYLLENNILYKLELDSASKEVAQSTNNDKIFDQILSTFKFTSAPTPTLKAGTSNLKTYNYNKVIFNYPQDWDLQPQIVSGSTITQKISDKNGIYLFTYESKKNYNSETAQPYKDIKEFINMPYELEKVIVGGQEAVRALPRAGSENIIQVYFFSKDTNSIISLKLETPIDGSKIDEGTKIFDQILASFKFNS